MLEGIAKDRGGGERGREGFDTAGKLIRSPLFYGVGYGIVTKVCTKGLKIYKQVVYPFPS
jgi:hypothetical protein